ncbi:MAG: hypothetical protein AABZ47_09650, partial [Planctomycetota bacterium]
GTIIGLIASQWAIDWMIASFPEELPYWFSFGIDWRVAAFTIGIAVFTTLAVGLLPSLRLAEIARRAGARIALGCMIAETSILSAAGLRFLQVCPKVTWAEGCFGRWLLSSDVVRKSLTSGLGGRPPKLSELGWGIEVERARLEALCDGHSRVFQL